METVTPPWIYTLHLPRGPRAPGIARAGLRAVLDAHGLAELTCVAELLVSELVTNAHLHTTGPYGLRLRRPEPRSLVVGVGGADPRVPPGFKEGAPATAPPEGAEQGRGLHLVRACADGVGVSVLRECGASTGGKLLWAALSVGWPTVMERTRSVKGEGWRDTA